MSVGTPVTVWQPTDGLSDFTDAGMFHIVDTLGFYLTDTTGFYIVDTGVIETRIPATIWREDDSI